MRAAIADGVAATGSMQPAAAAGVPAMDLNAAKTGIDFGQMLQAVRLVAISQRILEAEDANDYEGQYDLIHSLM